MLAEADIKHVEQIADSIGSRRNGKEAMAVGQTIRSVCTGWRELKAQVSALKDEIDKLANAKLALGLDKIALTAERDKLQAEVLRLTDELTNYQATLDNVTHTWSGRYDDLNLAHLGATAAFQREWDRANKAEAQVSALTAQLNAESDIQAAQRNEIAALTAERDAARKASENAETFFIIEVKGIASDKYFPLLFGQYPAKYVSLEQARLEVDEARRWLKRDSRIVRVTETRQIVDAALSAAKE